MKFLVDIQLPPRLCDWLIDHGCDALHASDLESGLNMPDEKLWQYAKQESLIVISKDYDFYERALLYGAPPQVLHISLGNCSNKQLMTTLDKFWSKIAEALKKDTRLAAVYKDKIEIFED